VWTASIEDRGDETELICSGCSASHMQYHLKWPQCFWKRTTFATNFVFG